MLIHQSCWLSLGWASVGPYISSIAIYTLVTTRRGIRTPVTRLIAALTLLTLLRIAWGILLGCSTAPPTAREFSFIRVTD